MPREEKKLGLFILVEPSEWTMDIVAVHGLNGDYIRSWKYSTTGTVWLTDFLPMDFPYARISSFGWDSGLTSSRSTLSYEGWGDQLGQELSMKRSNPEARRKPIVIIAHNVGGIVVKQMLVRSGKSSMEDIADIPAFVSAVLFFGTPHRGFKSTSALIVTKFASILPSVNTTLMSELRTDFLQRLNQEFFGIVKRSNMLIYSMYETQRNPNTGVVVTKDSAFLGYPTERLLGITTEHGQLVKFESTQDQGYIIVTSAIHQAIELQTQQGQATSAPILEPLEPLQSADIYGAEAENSEDSSLTGQRQETLPARAVREERRGTPTRLAPDLASIRREPTARFVFDTLAETSTAETGTAFAEQWFNDLRDQVHQTAEERRKESDQRIKVAIIDSGVDRTHPMLKEFFEKGQITAKSFIEGEPGTSDVCGHGTHMVDLVLRAAPNAHIFMAKVFLSGQSTEMDRNQGLIAEAIHYVTHTEPADIISMSWGYQKEISVITDAIRDAFHHNKILIASASNSGSLSKESVAFPANLRQVICINSTDGYGNPSEFNPSPSPDRTFAVIGEGLSVACPPKIGGILRVIRGTSPAAAIAAGIATLVLQYSREKANIGKAVERPHRLNHCDSMRKVFYQMANDRDGYHILVPAVIFHEAGPSRHYRISQRISGILDAL